MMLRERNSRIVRGRTVLGLNFRTGQTLVATPPRGMSRAAHHSYVSAYEAEAVPASGRRKGRRRNGGGARWARSYRNARSLGRRPRRWRGGLAAREARLRNPPPRRLATCPRPQHGGGYPPSSPPGPAEPAYVPWERPIRRQR